MKKPSPDSKAASAEAPASNSKKVKKGLVHPVIIYPFHQPQDTTDLEELYCLVAKLEADKARFARPITVMDRKTYRAMEWSKPFLEFRKHTVGQHSDLLDAWCVDTCQMWYTGLGTACERGGPEDIYWLIPGDFNYGSPIGKEVLSRLHDLPEIIDELQQDFCLGEITVDHTDPKRLIDTYGTFALLYNWFPSEAQELCRICEQPRSEFFALNHSFLREMLTHRWYAYEQTLVILLHAVFNKKRISRFSVGDICDLPHGRDSLASALQQLERTERVLKMVWREHNLQQPDWIKRFCELEAQSNQLRTAAAIILRNLLK